MCIEFVLTRSIRRPLKICDLSIRFVYLCRVEEVSVLDNVNNSFFLYGYSEHTFASHWQTVPSSCPEMMNCDRYEKPATVALLSSTIILSEYSFDDSAGSSELISYTKMVDRCPALFSMTPRSCEPSGENSCVLIKSHLTATVYANIPLS
jgi:hypothetical protein